MRPWGEARNRVRCMATMRVLQSYLDGALEDGPARRVASHLDACRRCGLEADVYRQIKASLDERDYPLDPRAIDRLRRFGEQLARSEASGPGDRGA